MRLKLLTWFLIFAMSACTFQVDVIETSTPAGAVLPIDSSTSTPIPTADHSATPPPLPTLSVTNTSLPASVGGPADPSFPIQFAPNGTYVDIIETLRSGEIKTYPVNAMKGQVMSVSFRQNDEETEWTYITMRIVGADGSILCADTCGFWRGILPATQDYFVSVIPSADASDFVMRVAINPPGAATQSFPYENKYRNATISYTDLFAPAFFPGSRDYRIEPELVLQFIDTQAYTDTNLSEAYLLFGSDTDPQVVATCTEPASPAGLEIITGPVTINGISFTTSERSGVGAGNMYEQIYHRALHAGMCFEVTYYMHYTNVGNYAPGTVTEFDRDALLQRFDEVLSTFTLK